MEIERREEENTEKISLEKREGFFEYVKRTVVRELRFVNDTFYSAFKDLFMLFAWMFNVKVTDNYIRKEAETFEIEPKSSNGYAIIGCHGFLSTPQIFEEIGPLLAEKGYYFRAIRLSGHGTSVSHLATKAGEDWFSSVVWHYKDISKKYDKIIYIGHSLGGTLGMLLGTIYPLEKIIALASPIQLPIKSAKYARFVSAFIKYWPRSKAKIKANRSKGLATYEKSPLYATYGVFEVGQILIERAEKLRNDILYFHADLDHFSYKDQPELMERYFENINLEIVYCEDTPHSMLVYGPKKIEIYNRILNWIDDLN